MRQVRINGVSYDLRYTLRSFFVYEEITGASYDNSKMSNTYILLYATLAACNADFPISFDALIDECDKDPDIFRTFMQVLEDEANRVKSLNSEAEGEKKKEV